MPRAKSGYGKEKEQSERFIQTARELEADESGEAFERAISVVIKADPNKTRTAGK